MKIGEIFKRLEDVAPVALSDEFCKKYNLYDNSGIIINSKNEINGAIFSLDLSQGAIDFAKVKGYNLIVTHHPAIYGGVKRIDSEDLIAECVKSGIAVISMHLNFDAAPEGIDYHLMKGLGGENAKVLCQLSHGGYGRVYGVGSAPFGEYRKRINDIFNSNRALFYGANDKIVSKIASFCGAGCDDNAMQFAVINGADVFASSDLKHHEITYLLNKGINVIQLTHYSAENYGFNKIYNRISADLPIPTAYHVDTEIL